MSKPRLIAALIRHGEYQQLPDTPSAHQPFPLTSQGEAQARHGGTLIRNQLASQSWELSPHIDSSQLLRAWQTADLIGAELRDCFALPVQVTGYDALAERGLGSAANLTQTQIRSVIDRDPRYPALPADWKSNSRYRLPLQGAESLLDAGARVAAHLQHQMQALGNESERDTLKLFVGHGAAFRHAAYHLEVLEFEQIKRLSMFHAKPVYLEYLAAGQWRHIAGDWKVRTMHGVDSNNMD